MRAPLLTGSAVALFALIASSLPAQPYTIARSFRSPVESFVGDTVELRYVVRADLLIEAPEAVPSVDWGRIDSVVVEPLGNEYEVRFVVTPFVPGTIALPRLRLGQVDVDGLSFVVNSVLDDDAQLAPAYGPLVLPGTRSAATIALIATVVLVSAGAFVTGSGRERIAVLLARLRTGRPDRRLARELARLGRGQQRMTARDCYTELIRALQDYMSARLGFDCRSRTSTELAAFLPALASMCAAHPSVAAPLAEVLTAADGAKFAGRSIRPKARGIHVDACVGVLDALESARRASKRRRSRSRSSDAHR